MALRTGMSIVHPKREVVYIFHEVVVILGNGERGWTSGLKGGTHGILSLVDSVDSGPDIDR